MLPEMRMQKKRMNKLNLIATKNDLLSLNGVKKHSITLELFPQAMV
jgi:hypothetical protein